MGLGWVNSELKFKMAGLHLRLGSALVQAQLINNFKNVYML